MRKIILTCAALSVLAVAVLSHAQTKSKAAAKVTPAAPSYSNTEAISESELQTYLYFLAADQLEGRNFPSRGFDTAAIFIATHLAEWGLKPAGSTSGTVGPLQPYLMPIVLPADLRPHSAKCAAMKIAAVSNPRDGKFRPSSWSDARKYR